MRSRLWALTLFVLGVLSLFGAAPTHAQFTPLCRSGTTGTKNCSGALNVSHVPSGIPAASIGSGQVPVANGGTGLSSYTTGALLYGASSSTTGQLTVGAANTVVTSNGTAPTYAALPTASSGSSTLASTFPLTTTNAYQDTGVSIAPPSAGTYLLAAQVKATLLATDAAPYATCRLYNVTAGAVLANSELFVAFAPAAGTYGINTATAQKTYTLAAASTIRLECARRQATVWSVSEIGSDVDGRTVLSYVKLAS